VPGKTFSARFQSCSFTIASGFQSGQLINTEKRPNDTTSRVTTEFESCRYEPGFGTPALPNTHVAILNYQGDYTFLKADLAGLYTKQAIKINPSSAKVIDQGTTVLYHIP
jgi:hypothetical protein